MTIIYGVSLGILGIYLTVTDKKVEPAKVEKSDEQLAKEGWLRGCTSHTVEEAQKMTDVIIDQKAATAKASLYCSCDWDYLRSHGVELDEIAYDLDNPDSRASKALTEAQDLCYAKYKSTYY